MPADIKSFQIAFRVYYEDTDAGGIMYYANYLKFAERARTELLRSLGYQQQTLREEEGLGFVVRRLEVDYHHPAKLDDQLMVDTIVSSLQRSSLTMTQRLIRDRDVLAKLEVQLVCVDAVGKPVRMPDVMQAAFKHVVQEPVIKRLNPLARARPVKTLRVPPKSKQH